jgi:methionine synthase / methylenetetrahydrofolate reductase(NADPH)
MVGDYPDALDSYDIVPTGLMRLIRHSFNQGKDYAGNSLGGSTNFLVGCALNLNAGDLKREANLLRKKIDHGAGFALTMPFYDAGVPRRFLDAYGGPIEIPVLAGVLPLYNERHASFLHNEVPGIEVPDTVLQRMAEAEDKTAEGIQVVQEVIQAMRGSVQGIYIMPPFKRYDIAATVIRAVAMPAAVPMG